ncbi:uncharacterized protein LOC110932535 [Helianthus annuus]|uniref:uncharacterized protein LOC110932535 n=1 Tax=Helianthus annuus TaxID=4232 RepID=UPI000B908175|nr:uncharacterized protein LOC110932535 [Helianthus annuus]
MNFLSINVRGIGGSVKEGWIKSIKMVHKIDFLAVQETKLEDFTGFKIDNLWGNTSYCSEFVGSVGQSGGLLCIWDDGIFQASAVIKNLNFLYLGGLLKGSNESLNIVNVYAPQSVVAKKALWDEILALSVGVSGKWIILGDFNAVRDPSERKNSKFKVGCAKNFNEFINQAGLLEYEMKGKRFTCIREHGKKLSKTDRILVCPEFFNKWPVATLRALSSKFSDHCPLILTISDKNFGPKPFRVFNSWFDQPGFGDLVESAVSQCGSVVMKVHRMLGC